MPLLEWNCYFKNDAITAIIIGNDGCEPTLKLSGEMDANLHAALHCLLEVARCVTKGVTIPCYFNPTIQEEVQERLVKCQWMRSGKLSFIGETDKRYHHAAKIEEAMMQKRTFTCTRRLYELVPKRRPSQRQVVAKKVSSGKSPDFPLHASAPTGKAEPLKEGDTDGPPQT